MPAFDKTGPQGQGSLTGRGFGPCGRGLGLRKGFGGGHGYGRGLGRYFGLNTPQTIEEKIEDIQAYKKALHEEIEDVEKELLTLQNK
jgi:hypothetical protein